MVQDSKATTRGGAGSCKIEAQCKRGVRADSMSSLIVAAGERRSSLGVVFENIISDAFFGHEMRGPAGTGHGGFSMAGGQKVQGAREGKGGKACTVMFLYNFLMYFSFLSR